MQQKSFVYFLVLSPSISKVNIFLIFFRKYRESWNYLLDGGEKRRK
jgi:hypothetical protein